MRRETRRRRSAFTLMEVLLVAGILAVLAAFAVPALFKNATKAKIDLARAAVGANGPISQALERYKYNMGRYPDTDEGLDVLLQPKDEVDDDRYEGPYLMNDRIEDPWNQPFEYRAPGDVHEDGFDLWSRGPDTEDNDGKEGTDDIKNWIEK